jgi:gluconate kinase
MIEMHTLRKLLVEKYTEAHFEVLLQIMDQLHDAATVNNLAAITPLTTREMIGWLDDIIYTAEETIRELEANANAFAAESAKVYSEN